MTDTLRPGERKEYKTGMLNGLLTKLAIKMTGYLPSSFLRVNVPVP